MRRVGHLVVMLSITIALLTSAHVLAQVTKGGAGEKVVEKKAKAVEKKAEAVEKKKVEAAAKVQVQQVAAPPGNPQVQEAQVVEFSNQFRPLMRAEYYFLRKVCGLTKDQRKLVAREGEKAVREVAIRYVKLQQGIGMPFGNNNNDPRKAIQETMALALKPLLSAEQQSRHKREIEIRADSLKQTAIDILIAKMDQDLVLTPEQREKIAESLLKQWQAAWGQSLEMLQNIDNFFPNIPDPVVVPHLTEKQKAVWKSIAKQGNVFFGWGMNGMMGNEEEASEDPELIEAKKEILSKKEQPK